MMNSGMSSSPFRRALAEFLADPKAVKKEAYQRTLMPHADPEQIELWGQWHVMREHLYSATEKRGQPLGEFDNAYKLEFALMAF